MYEVVQLVQIRASTSMQYGRPHATTLPALPARQLHNLTVFLYYILSVSFLHQHYRNRGVV